MDDFTQVFPDYDSLQEPVYSVESNVSNQRIRKRGKASKEALARKMRKWRAKNAGKYRKYQRELMRRRRSITSYNTANE